MKSRLLTVNKNIVEYRIGRNLLASSVARKDLNFSGISRPSNCDSEIYDVLSPLPINTETPKCRPHTRSRGSVADLPYVQPKILERKARNSS